jgi:hypothetical protein
MVARVLFPPAKSSLVAKKNIEMIQKYPPNPSIGKTLAIGVKSKLEGMEVMAIGEVKKGKVEEFMNNLAQQYQEYALEVEGFTYQTEAYFTISEAYKILGMEPPPED